MALSKFLVRIRFSKGPQGFDEKSEATAKSLDIQIYIDMDLTDDVLNRLMASNPDAYGRLCHYGETRIRQGYEKTIYKWFESKLDFPLLSDLDPWIKEEIEKD